MFTASVEAIFPDMSVSLWLVQGVTSILEMNSSTFYPFTSVQTKVIGAKSYHRQYAK